MELQPFTRGAAAPGTWCCSPWHTRLQVIRRKPEEFKIACLLDLRSLWPAEHSPFYAGFGNRDSDHTAYAAAGVPPARILIINPKGEIRHSSRTYCWASYPRLLQLAREMFPPIDTEEEQVEEDYTSFNYWKRPVAAMPVPAVAPPAEAPTTGAAIGTDAAAASNAAPAAAAATAATAAATAAPSAAAAATTAAAEEGPAPEEPAHGIAARPRTPDPGLPRTPAKSPRKVAKDPSTPLLSPGRRGPGALVVLDLAREAHGDGGGAGGETSVFELGGSWGGQETGGELQPDAGLLAGGGDIEWHRDDLREDDRGATAAADLPPTLARFTANASPTPRRPRPSPPAPSAAPSAAPSELEDVLLEETRVPALHPAQSPSDSALDEQISALEEQISALAERTSE